MESPDPLDEAALRRPGLFRPDAKVTLCEGDWFLPRPVMEFAVAFGDDGSPKMVPDGTSFGEAYGRLYDAFMEATGGVAQINAGVALAVDLLRRNYSLDPPALTRLLRYKPGDAANQSMWQSIIDVAIGNEGPKDEPDDDT